MNRLFLGIIASSFLISGYSALSQNVGIGTAGPLEKLHVIGNIRSSTLAGVGNRIVLADLNGTLLTATGLTSPAWMTTGNTGLINGTHFLGTTDGVDLRFRTANIERVTIKNTGAIGLFTNAPVTTWLHSIPTAACGDFQFKWENGFAGDAVARYQNTLISNGSRVFLGTTNYNGTAFAASAVIGIALNTLNTAPALAGAEGVRGFSNSNAGIGVRGGFTGGTLPTALGWAIFADGWAGGLSSWLNVSDERLKTNIQTIPDALDKIMKVRGVEYEFNTTAYPGLAMSDEKQLGFIAQELEQVFPGIVQDKAIPSDNNNVLTPGMYSSQQSYSLKAVAYTDMIPVLVEAIKEQQKIIESLQQRIKALENERK